VRRPYRYGDPPGGSEDLFESFRTEGVVRVGVDIGKMRDYTALVVTSDEVRDGKHHFATHSVERLPLGTPYPAVVDRIVEVMANLEARNERRRDARKLAFGRELLIDSTGVGGALIDLVRESGLQPIAVTLVGGDVVTEHEPNRVSMGKGYMVGRLQVLLQTKRLRLPESAEARILATELDDYTGQTNETGHTAWNARSGQHDDLVIALELSVGYGKPSPPPFVFAVRKVKGRW
jgi:hypothetical protein